MSKKSTPSICDLPDQVRDEDAARMAGAGNGPKQSPPDEDPLKGFILPGSESRPDSGSSTGHNASETEPAKNKVSLDKGRAASEPTPKGSPGLPPDKDRAASEPGGKDGRDVRVHFIGAKTAGEPPKDARSGPSGAQASGWKHADLDVNGKSASASKPAEVPKSLHVSKAVQVGINDSPPNGNEPQGGKHKLSENEISELSALHKKMQSGGMNGSPSETEIKRYEQLYKEVQGSTNGGAQASGQKHVDLDVSGKVDKIGGDAKATESAKALVSAIAGDLKSLREAHDSKVGGALATEFAKTEEKLTARLADHLKSLQEARGQKASIGPLETTLAKEAAAKIIAEFKRQLADNFGVAQASKDKMRANSAILQKVGKEIDAKAGKEAVKAITQIAMDAAIEAAKNAAKAAGTYHEVGSSKKDEPVKKTATHGDTTTQTSSGTYSSSTAKAATYTVNSDILKAAGASAGIEVTGGWQSKTSVTVDRYGVKSYVTEMWTDAKYTASASASADANTKGVAAAQASVRVALSAENGITVTVTDKDTGVSYTKSGVMKMDASADGTAKGTIAWTRAMATLGGEVQATLLSAAGSVGQTDAAGNTIGGGLEVKLGAAARANGDLGYSVNPVEGYGVKRSVDLGVSYGVSAGGSVKAGTDVTQVKAAADALLGHLSTKVAMDGSYKDGKIRLKLELGAAVGIGFNVAIDTEIDFNRWGENIEYRVSKIPPSQMNGHIATGLMGGWMSQIFGESKPPPETIKIWWDPTNKSKGQIAGHFAEEVKQFAKVRENNLQSELHKQSFNNKDKDFDLQFRWEGKSTLDYFTFEHPKNLSDRIAKEFGESQDKRITDLELTFNHRLPDYVAQGFQVRPDPNDPTKYIPDVTRGTYSIFSGHLSLVQFMSIEEHQKVAQMNKAAAEDYLRTNNNVWSEHLTGEAKAKLWTFWQEVQQEKERDRKADPPPYGEPHAPNNTSERHENELWWQAKNAVKNGTSEKQQIAEIEQIARVMSLQYKVKDDTLAPRTVIGSAELYKWKSVPRGEDGRHLIDLTEVKQGKIGLKDLLYQNEMKTLSKLGSPEAVYQYMTEGAHHIAEGSKGHFMQEWMSKNQNGGWRLDTDEASKRAQAWWAAHGADYWKTVDTGKYWETPGSDPKPAHRS